MTRVNAQAMLRNIRATHQETVAGFLVHDGDVCPVEQLDEFDHGLCLVFVRRDGACEERVALHRTEGWTSREETHLRSEQTLHGQRNWAAQFWTLFVYVLLSEHMAR